MCLDAQHQAAETGRSQELTGQLNYRAPDSERDPDLINKVESSREVPDVNIWPPHTQAQIYSCTHTPTQTCMDTTCTQIKTKHTSTQVKSLHVHIQVQITLSITYILI